MPRKSHAKSEKNIKSVRLQAILDLIANEQIGTQQELTDRLNADGYNVTQATVSRDIKELRLAKVALKDGRYCYKISHDGKNANSANKFFELYNTAVLRVDKALNQIVIHCLAGMAGAVCAAMDNLNLEEVIGTIAGDDTILVITRSEKAAEELMAKFRKR